MVDEIDIDLQPWSLEETQASILNELKSLLASGKVDSKTLATVSKNIGILAKDSKVVHDMDKQLKSVSKSSTKSVTQAEVLNKAFGKESKDRRKAESVRHKDMTDLKAVQKLGGKGIFDKAKRGLGSISDGAKGLVSRLSNFGGSLKELGAFAGGGLVGALTGLVVNQAETYQRLTNVGQTFGGSMLEMSRMAADAGLSLESVAKLTEKYSKVAANVGVKALLDHQKAVRKDAEQFGQWGMTLTQMTEFSTDHLEQLKVSGQFDRMTAKERTVATRNYLSDLTQLSKITGKRREEIAASMKKQRESVDAFTAEMTLQTPAQRKAFRETQDAMLSVANQMPAEVQKELSQALNQAQTLGTTARNDFIRNLEAMGGATAVATKEFSAAAVSRDPERIRKATLDLQDALGKLKGTEEGRAIALRAQGKQGAESMKLIALASQTAYKQSEKSTKLAGTLTDAEKARAQAEAETSKRKLESEAQATKTLMNLPSQLSTLAADMRKVFIEEFGPQMIGIVNDISKMVTDNQDKMKSAFALFKGTVGGLSSVTELIIANFGLLAAAAATLWLGFKAFRIGRFFKRLMGGGQARAAQKLSRAQAKAPAAASAASKAAPAAAAGANKAAKAGAKKAGAGIAGNLMKGARLAGRIASKAALPLAAAMAIADGVGGYQRAGENFDLKKGEEATAGQKASSTAGGVASGLTLGLVSEKDAAQWFGKLFGAGKTAQEKKVESKKAFVATALGDADMKKASIEDLIAAVKASSKITEEQQTRMIESLQKVQADTQSTAKSTKRSEPDPMAGVIGP